MNFVACVQPYMGFFHFFGQSLHYSLRENRDQRSKWHRFTLMIPTMLVFAVNLTLCAISCLLINSQTIKSYNISINISMFVEIVKIFAILHRNFACENLMSDLLQNFQSIELFFRIQLQRPISFTPFNQVYAKKLCWAFGAYALQMIFVAFYYFPYGKISTSGVVLDIMQFIFVIGHMYVLLFTDLVAFNLKHLNAIIARDIGKRRSDSEFVFVVKKVRDTDIVRVLLFKYKVIHFRLKKVTDQLNKYFGWTLLLLTLESLISLIILTKWQLKILSDFRNFMRLLCEIFF